MIRIQALLPVTVAVAAVIWWKASGPEPVEVVVKPPAPLGAIRTDMAAAEAAAFRAGYEPFVSAHPHLGPYFFGATCAECHFHPTLGGSGDRDTAAFLGPAPQGGMPFYTRSLPGWDPTPRPADATSRVAPPLYGLALIEQIPDDTIRAACSKGTGRFEPAKRLGSNPPNEVARFGFKAYLGTLPDFIGDVLRGAMGITSEVESTTDEDEYPDPEVDRAYVESLAAFVRGLPPPGRDGNDPEGEAAFHALGCANCHIPHMPPAQDVYSDFCLHNMGEELAEDGVTDRGTQPDEFRTQPLWGVRFRKVLMHDGRADTLEEAVLAHGGSATPAVDAYKAASPEQQAALIRFLRTL